MCEIFFSFSLSPSTVLNHCSSVDIHMAESDSLQVLGFPLYSIPNANSSKSKSTFLLGQFLYKSSCAVVHPHRIKITGFGSGQSALHCVGLGTYLDIAICPGILVQKEKMDRLDGALVNGFVVGVHFEMESEVEFTVVAKYNFCLQVVFVTVPKPLIDYARCPPFTFKSNGVYYWSYLPVNSVDTGVRNLQGLNKDSPMATWTFMGVQYILSRLRKSPVFVIRFVDPCTVESVCQIGVCILLFLLTFLFRIFL